MTTRSSWLLLPLAAVICVLGCMAVAAEPSTSPTTAPASTPLFTPQEVAAWKPKGPTECFRQICLEYNTPPRKEYAKKTLFNQATLEEYFSKVDPAAYAEFCKKINLDGVLMLAVPEGGYTTYLQTKVGEPYPYLKAHDFDFFGQIIKECHKRDMAVFGYVCIGWNKKAVRDFPDDFVNKGPTAIPSLNGKFADQIIEYAREILRNYPVDGLRTDVMDHDPRARTEGDKAFYRELYGKEMPEKFETTQEAMAFRIASISRFVKRFRAACQEIKPSVQIWHNMFNHNNVVSLHDADCVDISYEEFADPFATIFVQGVLNTQAVISGKLLQNPERRLCLVLNGRAYDYFPVNKFTALPDEETFAYFRKYAKAYKVPPDMEWFEKDLAPFYGMVAQIEPYLVGAKPVSDIAVVYSDASRYRFLKYDRKTLIAPVKALTQHWLNRNEVPRFVSSIHLSKVDLSKYKLVVVPGMSGMTQEELATIKAYAQNGGTVLWTGEADLYDDKGQLRKDFAQGGDLGLQLENVLAADERAETAILSGETSKADPLILPEVTLAAAPLTATRSTSGVTIRQFKVGQQTYPLVHQTQVGKGRYVYLATSTVPELTSAVADWLSMGQSIVTAPADKKAYLTWQQSQKRWVLHLMNDGDYTIDIRKEFAQPERVIEKYPSQGCDASVEKTADGIRIKVSGAAKDRVLVLQ